MRITLMTPDERAELADLLGQQNPAAPELVTSTTRAALLANAYPAGPVANSRARTTLLATPAVAARLLAAEQELTTTRDTLARILAAQEAGDYYSPDDVLHELDQAGIHLRADVEAAGNAADAEAAKEAQR
ncbi:hypothetical protein [Streptomyces sp. NPDC096323]|uniref:hypothetical protein n=1 Tax=Streptomyces sp. NPDC096323 TaxID=3155822 RepID=UPI00331C486B